MQDPEHPTQSPKRLLAWCSDVHRLPWNSVAHLFQTQCQTRSIQILIVLTTTILQSTRCTSAALSKEQSDRCPWHGANDLRHVDPIRKMDH